jgi:NADH dehydrogenase [ubiquinone] 1 alpha subcomplex assembly factor 7
MVIAHEFFDALPFHLLEVRTPVCPGSSGLRYNTLFLFQRRSEGWREVVVDLSPPSSNTTATTPSSPFRFALSPGPTPASALYPTLSTRFSSLSSGTRVEVSPASHSIGTALAKLVSKKGAGLIIDYGDAKAFGSSFRVWNSSSSLSRYSVHAKELRGFEIIKSWTRCLSQEQRT